MRIASVIALLLLIALAPLALLCETPADPDFPALVAKLRLVDVDARCAAFSELCRRAGELKQDIALVIPLCSARIPALYVPVPGDHPNPFGVYKSGLNAYSRAIDKCLSTLTQKEYHHVEYPVDDTPAVASLALAFALINKGRDTSEIWLDWFGRSRCLIDVRAEFSYLYNFTKIELSPRGGVEGYGLKRFRQARQDVFRTPLWSMIDVLWERSRTTSFGGNYAFALGDLQ
ncbi:MAG: hypothetical protein WC712_12990 [Candidatus Brocadiia bacterium]